METESVAQAAIWGRAYEIFVKRGVLALLVERMAISSDDARLAPWRHTRASQVYALVTRMLGVVDDEVRKHVHSTLDYLAACGYGTGYSVMRQYLDRLGKTRLRAFWCPLTLPDGSEDDPVTAFHAAFSLPGHPDPKLASTGMPARADFALWLAGDSIEHLAVFEFSYDADFQLHDFTQEDAHLGDALKFRRRIDARSVFSHVSAEIHGEGIIISDDLRMHLGALSSEDKPFYKLCQAASYADQTVKLLDAHALLSSPCEVRAFAITSHGIESISARYVPQASDQEPRFRLLAQLGNAYRYVRRNPDERDLSERVEAFFQQTLNRLPRKLRLAMKNLRALPKPGSDYGFDFEEEIDGFLRPSHVFTRDEALALVPERKEVDAFFGIPAREAIAHALTSETATLRDLHAAAVIAGLEAAKPGRITALALEGNPGIGKTTALMRHLAKREGFFFIYLSPRIVINRDVTSKIARIGDGTPSGVLTLTTNARLIAAATNYYKECVEAGTAQKRFISGAVVVDGVADSALRKPEGTILYLSPDEEETIEIAHHGQRLRKKTISEHHDVIVNKPLGGVMRTLAAGTRELLEANPEIDRVALAVAVQGYKRSERGDHTVSALSHVFSQKANPSSRLAERRAFAKRFPLIVVMVDELAGDGAGAPLVHAITKWLYDEFIQPFAQKEEQSPFRITLVISDASLTNEIVMDRYLAAGDKAPDKVYISQSRGSGPFDLAATHVRVGGLPCRALHVMANSFPARKLTARYRLRLHHLYPDASKTARSLIQSKARETAIDSAVEEIKNALEAGASQVIYFAQDKALLRRIRRQLITEGVCAKPDEIRVLDQSTPARERKEILKDATRDATRLFLMTSSGARGVSFPKADWIIVAMPRFSLEASLMEIAQLIYRGRGSYRNEHGEEVSGDDLDRCIIFRIDDFIVMDEQCDVRQWLRRSLDFMTLLVLLRATILTRLTGDSGLSQNLAIVPVGRIAEDSVLSLLATHVQDFLREAETYSIDAKIDAKIKGVLQNAIKDCVKLFSNNCFAGMFAEAAPQSFAREETALAYFAAVKNTVALLPDAAHLPQVPTNAIFYGPLVLEEWSGLPLAEAFEFSNDAAGSIDKLLSALRYIGEQDGIPAKLRDAAHALREILGRKKTEISHFVTEKSARMRVWVAFPIAYAQFLCREDAPRVRRADDWYQALRCLHRGLALPLILQSYEKQPWVAYVDCAHPDNLDIVFDDRFLAASSELNLLNALLLTE